MKIHFTILAFFIATVSFSQTSWMALTGVENRFYRFASEHGIKHAFLQFMDTSAVVFEKGEVKKAQAYWMAKDTVIGRLIWDPAFVVIDNDGQMGITSGPWQFKTIGTKDSTIATGEYTTVWVKKDTTWKWVLDMGIEHNQKIKSTTISGIEMRHAERSTYPGLRFMLINEENFYKNYAANGKNAYLDIADDNIYFVTQGFTPVNGIYRINDALLNMSGTMQFKALGSACSPQGDIGYVYGSVTDNDKKGNFLHVWRRIGRKWTLLLQTLTI